MRRRRSTATPPPSGFTLIELLVVIVILGLLVGLLVPAVMRAVGTARDATAAAEVQAMAQALADFKSKYNEYPPSRIVCSENGDYSLAGLGGAGTLTAALGPRTVATLKRYWPRMSLNTSGTSGAAAGVSATNGSFYDFNGNDTLDSTPYVLTGSECLVFFLGGVPQSSGGGTSWSMTGFSKNPTNPFQSSTVTTNRTQPLYEFNNGRLAINSLNTSLPAPGFPGYLDPLGVASDPGVIPFYAYFSAYGGAGYDPDDCNMTEPDTSNVGVVVQGGFPANGAAFGSAAKNGMAGYCWSPAPNPYTSSPPIPTTGATGTPDTTNKKPRAWVNANSFQLISAGRDRFFGTGGQYLSSGNVKLPFVATSPGADTLQSIAANVAVTGVTLGNDIRFREQDNITNFSQGRLE